ncbi:MAG: type II toxin-antitoxin system HicB family antitoxin [Spirochaetaceae bacterium]|nr:type II toxin-antitoxin system HicB family antitoxin [Spirochaetaceae bacterium]
MNIRVVIEFDEETHSYSAVCPELPGCASFGDTEDEAFQNVKEAHVY